MFISITDKKEAENKGSSVTLVHYLEKENRTAKKAKQELWFNAVRSDISAYEVMRRIDDNVAKLGRNDPKFFLINISPSKKEVAFLLERFGRDGAREELKKFTSNVMDEYARNFKRDGITGRKDLLWYGKLEDYRYYSHTDREVKNGEKKRGERKDGEQMHIQVIVSRKDISNRIKLSPQNTSRGKNIEHSKKMGQFDRLAFKQSGESVFDELFGFDRQLKETLAFANTQKNGSLSERTEMAARSLEPDLVLPTSSLGEEREIHLSENLGEDLDIEVVEYLPLLNEFSIDISDDIDDEAILGRNRHRKRKARTNTR
ncbi:molybdopterin-guanine dinucleotide biosynthesis protein MobB [Sphingobacteriaceae bacterium GW460-11-11-14-LB5]|nr:molybdopterin-guanine dinucleotide biosynthesis protein MobB [Sphingobacteriaceae bacterium GW460-11-11-14-LB5]